MQHDALKVNSILACVVRWAEHRAGISALALVGSQARGTARPDSDIDLMFLTSDPSGFRNDEIWMNEIEWGAIDRRIDRWQDKDYGLVWSRHVYLDNNTAIEFSFGDLRWASTEPIDTGTIRVICNGCRTLYDPEGRIANLMAAVRSQLT